MTMMLRRALMEPAGGGDDPGLMRVTINSEPETLAECWAAVQAAVNLPGANYIAFVDDYAYITGESGKCVCVVNGHDNSGQSLVFRNDSGTYGYMRKFSASGTTACSIPAGTVFRVYVYPDS